MRGGGGVYRSAQGARAFSRSKKGRAIKAGGAGALAAGAAASGDLGPIVKGTAKGTWESP